MARVTPQSTSLLLGALQRRQDATEVQSGALLEALSRAPEEYVLASSGDGTLSVLKPKRDGVSAADAVKVTDADSGRVLELVRRGEDLQLGGKTFHQYVLNPLKYDVSAQVGRPR